MESTNTNNINSERKPTDITATSIPETMNLKRFLHATGEDVEVIIDHENKENNSNMFNIRTQHCHIKKINSSKTGKNCTGKTGSLGRIRTYKPKISQQITYINNENCENYEKCENIVIDLSDKKIMEMIPPPGDKKISLLDSNMTIIGERISKCQYQQAQRYSRKSKTSKELGMKELNYLEEEEYSKKLEEGILGIGTNFNIMYKDVIDTNRQQFFLANVFFIKLLILK
jgi:hypothetical protein